MPCKICGRPLSGKQTKFCGSKCKSEDVNHRHKKYAVQHKKGFEQKVKLIDAKGGGCEVCGYSKNIAALSFAGGNITLRECANRSPKALEDEAAELKLLCLNCRAERTHPELTREPG